MWSILTCSFDDHWRLRPLTDRPTGQGRSCLEAGVLYRTHNRCGAGGSHYDRCSDGRGRLGGGFPAHDIARSYWCTGSTNADRFATADATAAATYSEQTAQPDQNICQVRKAETRTCCFSAKAAPTHVDIWAGGSATTPRTTHKNQEFFKTKKKGPSFLFCAGESPVTKEMGTFGGILFVPFL